MKQAKRLIPLIALMMALTLLFASCDAAPGGYLGEADYRTDVAVYGSKAESLAPPAAKLADDAFESEIDSMKDGGVSDEAGGAEETREAPKPGQITASAWNDNQYYDLFKDLFLKGQTAAEDGRFLPYATDTWHLFTQNRVRVTVKNGDEPVAGAIVTCEGACSAVTNAAGVAYVFPETDAAGSVSVRAGGFTASGAFTEEERDVTVSLDGTVEKADIIEIMFVVDVTGSMGDELNYFKSELGDVIRRVVEASGGSTKIQLAFLFYRDDGDDEKFAYEDFCDVTDPEDYKKMQNVLKKQQANGGGDYPEAVDEALLMATEKQWMSGNTTKLIFHLLDAPAHNKDAYKTRFAQAIRQASEKGIRVCPILASGADTLCEYTSRAEALYTGGTFIFVTSDSGIGGAHLDPILPNAVVEYLNDLLVRVIYGYHVGTFQPPVAWNGKVHEHVWMPGQVFVGEDGAEKQAFVCSCGEVKYVNTTETREEKK